MSRSRNTIFSVIFILIIAYLTVKKRMMFSDPVNDYFYDQIYDFLRGSHAHEVWLVHCFRYISVLPYWHTRSLLIAPALHYIIFTLTNIIFFYCLKKKFLKDFKLSILFFSSLLIPLVLSYRTVLSMLVPLALYFVLADKARKNRGLALIGIILANLSSGCVLGWLAISILSIKQYFKKLGKIFGILSILILGQSFIFSLDSKIEVSNEDLYGFRNEYLDEKVFEGKEGVDLIIHKAYYTTIHRLILLPEKLKDIPERIIYYWKGSGIYEAYKTLNYFEIIEFTLMFILILGIIAFEIIYYKKRLSLHVKVASVGSSLIIFPGLGFPSFSLYILYYYIMVLAEIYSIARLKTAR